MSGMSNSKMRVVQRRRAALPRLEANLTEYRAKTFKPELDDKERAVQIARIEAEIVTLKKRIQTGGI